MRNKVGIIIGKFMENIFKPVLIYKGEIDLSKNNYTVGDVTYFPDSEGYGIYTNEGWDMIYTEPIKYKEMLPKICKCCGAPLKGWKCEYCEVEYD